MAREKTPPPPGDDIPAWFMTYSDVITLLMTFFILLLTFATTEPERFEKSVSSTFSKGAATGTAGKKIDGMIMDSWTNRLRPPAARIAMRGAEMPPIDKAPAQQTFGEGLKSLTDDEEKQNEMTSHGFEVPLAQVFDSKGELTSQGRLICKMLSNQLRELPFQAAVQFSDPKQTANIAGMLSYLFDIEKTRPGQVAMSIVKPRKAIANVADKSLDPTRVRISIRRFSENVK
jgi:flagellar motor protein MotB